MTFADFKLRADEVFESIPEEFRVGIDGVEVLPKIVYHPKLEEIYTLGECLTEAYPSDFGGAGQIRSRVVLYYGSFAQISKEDEEWDWDEEIYETITHEIRHHLEHLASDESLEEMDYAEDQNFARLDGAAFETFFYRSGSALADGIYRVGEELFAELEASADIASGTTLEVFVGGSTIRFAAPADRADVHFVAIPESCWNGEELLTVVLLRKQSSWRAFKSILGTSPLVVRSSDAEGCTSLQKDASR